MTDWQIGAIGTMFLLVVVAITAQMLDVEKRERHKMRRDWLAERKRRITHRAFKSRAGIRE